MVKKIDRRKGNNSWIKKLDFSHLDKKISFSFKYLTFDNDFCITKYQDLNEIKSCFDRLKSISDMECKDFKCNPHRALRNHKIDFSDTSRENFWFPWEEQLIWEEWIYQFAVSQAKWRMIGFILKDIFYIVWLDPNHTLYS